MSVPAATFPAPSGKTGGYHPILRIYLQYIVGRFLQELKGLQGRKRARLAWERRCSRLRSHDGSEHDESHIINETRIRQALRTREPGAPLRGKRRTKPRGKVWNAGQGTMGTTTAAISKQSKELTSREPVSPKGGGTQGIRRRTKGTRADKGV
jgi:hypothetical protein